MKTSLANTLLRALLVWDLETETEFVGRLTAMAEWKWDSYEGFRAGQRFMESLARWLPQFPDPETRFRWLSFLLDDLIFISAAEVDHLISLAYRDFIRPSVLDRVATRRQIPLHLKRQVTGTPEFRAEQRRLLVLGLSDGARLDLLRRNADGLSHEQFVGSSEVPRDRRADLSTKLAGALASFGSEAEATFNHVLLVDDFYGSGTSLIDWRVDPEGGRSVLKGKTSKFLQHADSLTSEGVEGEPALLSADYRVTILLYIASARARNHIETALQSSGLADRWDLQVIQTVNDNFTVTDERLLLDCNEFWDPVLEDEHKNNSAQGYKSTALPLVLYHNSPNNSISPIWADSAGRRRAGIQSKERRALFPRYERHHSERP